MRALVSSTKARSSSTSLLTTATIGRKYAKNSALRAGTSSKAKSGSGCETGGVFCSGSGLEKKGYSIETAKAQTKQHTTIRLPTPDALGVLVLRGGKVADGACRPESPCGTWHGSCKSQATRATRPRQSVNPHRISITESTMSLFSSILAKLGIGTAAAGPAPAPQRTPAPSAQRPPAPSAAGSAAAGDCRRRRTTRATRSSEPAEAQLADIHRRPAEAPGHRQ